VAVCLLIGGPGSAPADAQAADDPFAPASLGETPGSAMSALLEVTIFDIDVLTLTVRTDARTGARLAELATAVHDRDALEDSVAAVLFEARDLWARQVFHRDVGLDRLLGGMTGTVERALRAGFIGFDYFDEFVARMPEVFGFLADEGAKEGDEIVFLVQGDELRTLYRTVEGQILMDRATSGPDARRASIPAFFAPETRFRKQLVESLIHGQDTGSSH
jgi:hypothetical protein